jgi:hypothetical protein
LNSFTIHLSSKKLNDGETENVDIRLGTISRPEGVFTFTEIYSENAVMAPSPEADCAAQKLHRGLIRLLELMLVEQMREDR